MKVAVAFAVIVLAVGVALPPAHAETSSFSTCAALVKKYPNGIARSGAAANTAVSDGMKKPKVSASLYKINGNRLDRDGDGVICEQPDDATAAATPTPSPSAGLPGVVYVSTGVALLDFWMKSKNFTQKQATYTYALSKTIQKPQFTSLICEPWRDLGTRPASFESLMSSSAGQLNEEVTDAWLRSQLDMIVKLTCVFKGYVFTD